MNQTVTKFKGNIQSNGILGSGLEFVPIRILDPKTPRWSSLCGDISQEKIASYAIRERGSWKPVTSFAYVYLFPAVPVLYFCYNRF